MEWRIISSNINTQSVQKDIGMVMTLPRDYTEVWKIEVVIQDIFTEVCRRARKKGLMGSIVTSIISLKKAKVSKRSIQLTFIYFGILCS